MELQTQFEEAVAGSKALAQKPGNDVLLKLYSLYKQATNGDTNTEGPDNAFDFVAKAKYNAWAELKGTPKDAAMQEYITLVNSLK